MTASSETTELRILNLTEQQQQQQQPQVQLQLVAKRAPKVEYDADIRGSTLYILTNLGAPNYRVMTAALAATAASASSSGTMAIAEMAVWRQLECAEAAGAICKTAFDVSDTVTVQDIRVFRDHLVVGGREGGLTRVWILALTPDDDRVLSVHEVAVEGGMARGAAGEEEEEEDDDDDGEDDLATLSLDVYRRQDFEADSVRLVYSSLVTPERVLECTWPPPTPSSPSSTPPAENGDGDGDGDGSSSASYPKHRAMRLVRETPVPNYDASLYRSWRLWATPAADSSSSSSSSGQDSPRLGVKIPISCVRRRGGAAAALGGADETMSGASTRRSPGPLLLYGK